ncbi:DUF3644 domain-containing protein, partial [Listeria monocytogenes]|nr:DUF3644 domain-containing protein [Listeria monocytogenes]
QKDPNKTHPYTQKNCVKEINKILSREKIDFEHFSVFTKEIRSNFNTADFQLFLKFYSLKAQERYSYRHVIGEHSQYTYSRAIIDFILTEIKKNPQKTIEHLKKKTKK